MAETTTVSQFPWQPQSEILGNLAIGNLRGNLLARLTTERGIHSESLLTAIGALAGFAAQNAALTEGAEITAKEGHVPQSAVIIATTKAGERFVFGDWPNRYLFNEADSVLPLFALVAGAMLKAGAEQKDLPDCGEIAGHVARTVGAGQFGVLRASPDHTAAMQPAASLELLWGWFEGLMRLPLPEPMKEANEPPLREIWWPIVASIVAGQLTTMAKDVLAPRLGGAMIVEAAVIASKIDPEKIVPGRWKLDIRAGALAITRTGA